MYPRLIVVKTSILLCVVCVEPLSIPSEFLTNYGYKAFFNKHARSV